MSDKDTQFEDAEQYNYSFDKNKLSFKDIILLHLKKIGEFSSTEFRGGFWETRTKIVGGLGIEDRYYVPDSREVYSNSVEYLADMLSPYFDEDMRTAEEEANKKIEKVWNDNTVEEKLETEEDVEGQEKKRKFPKTKDRLSYRSERREINRKLFRALCCFLFRKKYLEMGTIKD